MSGKAVKFVKNNLDLILLSVGVAGIIIYLFLRKRKENLNYLEVYDGQDRYKNSYPGDRGWPVVNTYTTAKANIVREQIAEDEKVYTAGTGRGCLYKPAGQ